MKKFQVMRGSNDISVKMLYVVVMRVVNLLCVDLFLLFVSPEEDEKSPISINTDSHNATSSLLLLPTLKGVTTRGRLFTIIVYYNIP